MLQTFVKTYHDHQYRFPTMLRHSGMVLAFAMDERRRLRYTALDSGAELPADAPDAARWLTNPVELRFATELAHVGFGAADQTELPTVKLGGTAPVPAGTTLRDDERDLFLSSTARLTAAAPFQVLSDGRYVYLLRQAISEPAAEALAAARTTLANPAATAAARAAAQDVVADHDNMVSVSDGAGGSVPLVGGTLLVDRFVLVGTELQPKREVRFQRSRSRTRPLGSKDSLGAADLEQRPFVEPTQELRFVTGVTGGRFTAVLVPTDVAEMSRWQLFVPDPAGEVIWSYSVERGEDGLFDTRGSQAYTCPNHPEIFAFAPGPCPRSDGQDLVPIVDTSGAAGSGLLFTAAGDRVKFGKMAALGPQFTLEAWIKPAVDLAGTAVLLGSDKQDRQASPSLAVGAGGKLQIGFGDGSNWHETTTREVLSPGRWSHVSVSFDGSWLSVCVNGSVADGTSALAGLVPARTPITDLGAPADGFRGAVDELRLWRVARSPADVRADLHQRLSGLEPGLAGYWPLDEAHGELIFDQAGGGSTGRLSGPAWVTSDAPVGRGPGLARSALRLDGRATTGGLASVLYHQQEATPSGYATEPKLLKQAARVMLAVGTATATEAADAAPELAVLDFGVGRDGQLAALPAAVPLAQLVTGGAAGSIDAQLEAMAQIEAQIGDAGRQVQALRELLATERAEVDAIHQSLDLGVVIPVPVRGVRLELDSLIGRYQSVTAQLAVVLTFPASRSRDQTLVELQTAAQQCVTDLRQRQQLLAAQLPADTGRLDAQQAELARLRAALDAARAALNGDANLPMPLVHLDRRGLTVAGGLLDFARTADAPVLFDSALGRLALYFRGLDGQFRVAYYATTTRRPRLALPAESGAVAFVARVAGQELDGFEVTAGPGPDDGRCTVTISMPAPDGTRLTETWQRLPREPRQLAAILSGTAPAPVFVGRCDPVESKTDQLTIPAGLSVAVPAGGLLRVGDTVVTATARAARGAGTVLIEPSELPAPDGAPVYAVAYDPAAASSTAAGADLSRGSLLVAADAAGAAGAVQLAAAVSTGPAPACRWYADPPGTTLDFDGTSTVARLADRTALAGLDATGDLTVEAWVRPSQTAPMARLVQHQSPASSYGLALHQVPSGLSLNGTAYVAIPKRPALDVTGQITLEAWVQPASSAGLQYIVAHGLQAGPPSREVALRIVGGQYQVGSYYGTDHFVAAPMADADRGHWVHLAGVYDGTSWLLYRNGTLVVSRHDPVGAVSVDADWAVGGSATADRYFTGGIDQARVWDHARSAADILATMNEPATGAEAGLVAAWRWDGGTLRDVGPNGADGTPHGPVATIAGAIPSYRAVAAVGDLRVETVEAFPGQTWTHLAAAFAQSYALRFGGRGGYLDAGTGRTLDLARDLTIEVTVQLDDLATAHGLISKGVLDAGTGDDVPYSLSVAANGQLVFAFSDSTHVVGTVVSAPNAVQAGRLQRIAVTRKRGSSVSKPPAGQPGAAAIIDSWDDITFYVDRAAVSATAHRGPDPGSGAGPLVLGRAYGPGATELPLRGVLTEARVWSVARDAATIGRPIKGTEVGLVAWWQLAENTGNVTDDSKGTNAATLHGPVSWVKTPDPAGSGLLVYRDGLSVATQPLPAALYQPAEPQFTLGALGNGTPGERLRGQLEELRIWRTTRTAEQIQDNLFRRLTGEREDLIAYYTFDATPGRRLLDDGPRGLELSVVDGTFLLSTAPIAEDTPQARNAVAGIRTGFNRPIGSSPAVSEYADLQTDGNGRTTGAFKRCYGYIALDGQWQLVTGFKVGDMVTEWVGQAQFAPQLIGYIEGAPPVPGENLTVQDDYAGASSVAVTEASTTTYTYATSRDAGINASLELAASVGDKAQAYVGAVEIEAPLGLGVGQIELFTVVDTAVSGGVRGSFETAVSWLADAQSGAGSTNTQLSTLELTGHKEPASAVSHRDIGPRYVPDNTGFALVQSQTADVFALRLLHTGALIAYQMRPNPDIPKDWNIITFPINPRYTKQGTLDGKIGWEADADYPNALNYTPDSSYFKPIEAYQLKTAIEREQQQMATLFEQYNAEPGRASSAALPPLVRRNMANTYVWTAAGGQFAETMQSFDTHSETAGGAYSFAGLVGTSTTVDVALATVALTFDVQAMLGGHIEASVSKTKDSERSFGLDVALEPEQNISTVDGRGRAVRQPGKVDAYRFMTFYLAPQNNHHDLFFNQVVDPIWLAQSDDPAAVALRQSRQDGKRPACWRVLHRVTYVSRVLAPLADNPSSVEQTLRSLDIDSNYELIKAIGPFVRDHTGRYADFAAAVRSAVRTYLPDLLTHIDAIIEFLVLYYGVTDAPQLTDPGR